MVLFGFILVSEAAFRQDAPGIAKIKFLFGDYLSELNPNGD
jgi:hypothetical protein